MSGLVIDVVTLARLSLKWVGRARPSNSGLCSGLVFNLYLCSLWLFCVFSFPSLVVLLFLFHFNSNNLCRPVICHSISLSPKHLSPYWFDACHLHPFILQPLQLNTLHYIFKSFSEKAWRNRHRQLHCGAIKALPFIIVMIVVICSVTTVVDVHKLLDMYTAGSYIVSHGLCNCTTLWNLIHIYFYYMNVKNVYFSSCVH